MNSLVYTLMDASVDRTVDILIETDIIVNIFVNIISHTMVYIPVYTLLDTDMVIMVDTKIKITRGSWANTITDMNWWKQQRTHHWT